MSHVLIHEICHENIMITILFINIKCIYYFYATLLILMMIVRFDLKMQCKAPDFDDVCLFNEDWMGDLLMTKFEGKDVLAV